MSDFGDKHRYNVTGLFHDMWGFPSNNPKIVNNLLRHLVDKIDNNIHNITRYKEHYLEDARYVLVSYGSSARSALHFTQERRNRGERIGVLELQSIWPFPSELVREKCAKARAILVVEMNMGQVMAQVQSAVDKPKRVFLANRLDGKLITPHDIKRLLRVIKGKGV
jgi:2-oxoglutarate ferredoxin oxidoreductase subunit alpha